MTRTWRVAIVGCGIAGRARARAIAVHPRAELVQVHRGRHAAELGVPVVGADEVLEGVDLVVIASPSETHEGWVRRALDAGCHVVCEYPLARTEAAARRLLEHAAAVGRVLHVEHIELLAPTTRWLAEQVGAGWTRSHLVSCSGGEAYDGGPQHAWSCLARLHRIVAVLGWPEAIAVERADGEGILATLRWGDGRELAFEAVRRPDVTRRMRWEVVTPSGRCAIVDRGAERDGVTVDLPASTLFLDDLDAAIRRIEGEDAAYLSDGRLLAVLALAESLGFLGTTGVPVKAP